MARQTGESREDFNQRAAAGREHGTLACWVAATESGRPRSFIVSQTAEQDGMTQSRKCRLAALQSLMAG